MQNDRTVYAMLQFKADGCVLVAPCVNWLNFGNFDKNDIRDVGNTADLVFVFLVPTGTHCTIGQGPLKRDHSNLPP